MINDISMIKCQSKQFSLSTTSHLINKSINQQIVFQDFINMISKICIKLYCRYEHTLSVSVCVCVCVCLCVDKWCFVLKPFRPTDSVTNHTAASGHHSRRRRRRRWWWWWWWFDRRNTDTHTHTHTHTHSPALCVRVLLVINQCFSGGFISFSSRTLQDFQLQSLTDHHLQFQISHVFHVFILI